MTAVTEMRDGEIVLLENLRFYPGEDANDAQFARDLAELCDVYCDDAFSLAHRGRASTVAITRHVRPATAGLALARELMMFEPVLEHPEPPFVGLVAGARIEEKLPILENLLPKLNRLFIGGALCFTFFRAQGREIGAASVDDGLVPLAEDFLSKAKKKRSRSSCRRISSSSMWVFSKHLKGPVAGLLCLNGRKHSPMRLPLRICRLTSVRAR